MFQNDTYASLAGELVRTNDKKVQAIRIKPEAFSLLKNSVKSFEMRIAGTLAAGKDIYFETHTVTYSLFCFVIIKRL